MAGTLDSLFGGIKSIQRGQAAWTAGADSFTVTITAVDTSKSVLLMTAAVDGDNIRYITAGNITNSTTLTFTRYRTGAESVNGIVEWQVVESN